MCSSSKPLYRFSNASLPLTLLLNTIYLSADTFLASDSKSSIVVLNSLIGPNILILSKVSNSILFNLLITPIYNFED